MPIKPEIPYFYVPFVVDALTNCTSLTPAEAEELLMPTPNSEFGDIAFPCFALAKSLKRPPKEIAARLVDSIRTCPPIERVTVEGPYLNFHLDKAIAAKLLLDTVSIRGVRWANDDYGCGKNICIDFCSPNIAKPLHLGHLRTTVIGNSIARLHEMVGYRVFRINYLGDWGTAFGKLSVAWRRWGDAEAVKENPTEELLRVYVKFHEEAEKEPELLQEARDEFRRLEAGDIEARQKWEWIRARSLEGLDAILKVLQIEFDVYDAESHQAERADEIVRLLMEKDLLVESDGAKIVELGEMPPCLILRNDGATLYPTRDIAAALEREAAYNPVRSLYVVDKGQSLHFNQVFGVLRKMGYDWSEKLQHVEFGVMRVGGKRLRTREGDIIYLADVLSSAVELARKALEERSPGLDNAEEIACDIGVGAIIFNDLKHQRIQDIDFNPEEAIRFDGETGPYIQYTHARCMSILEKAKVKEADYAEAVPNEFEWQLVLALSRFPGAIRSSADSCEPHITARLLLDISKSFNRFYKECPVIKAEDGIRGFRLSLVRATALTLKQGLWALGMKAPRMRE